MDTYNTHTPLYRHFLPRVHATCYLGSFLHLHVQPVACVDRRACENANLFVHLRVARVWKDTMSAVYCVCTCKG